MTKKTKGMCWAWCVRSARAVKLMTRATTPVPTPTPTRMHDFWLVDGLLLLLFICLFYYFRLLNPLDTKNVRLQGMCACVYVSVYSCLCLFLSVFMTLPLSLSFHSFSLSFCLYLRIFICLCLYISLFLCSFVSLSVCLCFSLSVVSVSIFVCLCFSVSVCLSVSVSLCFSLCLCLGEQDPRSLVMLYFVSST